MEMNYIHSLTGKYPAIRGLDYGDFQNWSTRAIPWWRAGGIDMVSYHMGAPGQPVDGWSGAQLSANINAVLTPGTAQYKSFISRLNRAASKPAKAQAAGVLSSGVLSTKPGAPGSGGVRKVEASTYVSGSSCLITIRT